MELETFEDALEALIASGAEHYGDGESMETAALTSKHALRPS